MTTYVRDHRVELFASRQPVGAVYAECLSCGWVTGDFFDITEAQQVADEHASLTIDPEAAA